ncbi:hypothetical protein HNP82_001363 [Catenibacillus scindens]|uniref:LysM domain-containing protein n=1 Tax=Catenibacillus scindens TaxID=673271 RepID=A0A7W8HAR9_9FIRM|nr:SPOCS domain-containing protein [Catenibacillus scindens]MBB5264252.1 hypothetical protein [Catenibacillus scindens]
MEILKKRIRTNQFKGRAFTQVTLDDDFNVPDVRPDIDKIIEENGDIKITEVRVMEGKVSICGKLEFAVLYISGYDSRPIHHMDGCIDFEEVVNMDNVAEGDDVKVSWDMEDLRTSLINSRKLSVRSIIALTLNASCIVEIEAALNVEGGKDVCSRTRRVDTSQIHIQKKDTFRIKDEITVPANKPNIMEILWNDAAVDNLDIRLMDDKISLRGELGIFVMYSSEEEKNPLQFFNTTSPFSGNLECHGAKEEMIGHITARIIHTEIEVRRDSDMEARNVGIEVVLELEMAVYEDETTELLSDVYALDKKLVPVYRPAVFDNILMKNQSDMRLHQRIKIKNDQAKILQICQAGGHVKVDRTQINESGILVEGVVYVQILYVAADDRMPVNALKGMVPFSCQIEIPEMDNTCTYEISPVLEQVSSNMLDSEEIEIKMMLVLSAIVFKRMKVDIIEDIKEEACDQHQAENIPGIIGYIVRPGDELWTLAKKFNTTMEDIMSTNNLEQEQLSPKQKLVITIHG